MPTLSTRILQGLLLSVVGGLLGRFLMLILENAGLSDAAMPVAFAIFIASLVYWSAHTSNPT